MSLDQAIASTRAHLLSLRNERGHWVGELSSSALSTATAVVALSLVDAEGHATLIKDGARWLAAHQNADGGWGDTTISKSNLSTTLLCWSALTLVDKQRAFRCPDDIASSGPAPQSLAPVFARCESWLRERAGSLEPDAICRAVIARYGKDKTFSVPILMTCALGGRLGEHDKAWRRVLSLPFELAALPRTWFGAIGLPVVSYALPALIAIGYARFHHAPPSFLNPLRWLRALFWYRVSPMLKTLQPSTGGYLEATPLTSFVTMALAGSGEKHHPCVPDAVRFLRESQREDGSWPIDTNLATWGTTLAVKALAGYDDALWSPGFSRSEEAANDRLKPGLQPFTAVREWLLDQQYKAVHPFTNAAPGGWAWTDLPGGVPDADDTSGALIALWHLMHRERKVGRTVLSPPTDANWHSDAGDANEDRERSAALAGASALPIARIEAGIAWLLDLQNRDGGVPTFCRGWGTLPFDRSTPEITAHAIWAVSLWVEEVDPELKARAREFIRSALSYLDSRPTTDWKGRLSSHWIPLWFGNEHAADEENRVFGTAKVIRALVHSGLARRDHWERYLTEREDPDAFLATRMVKEGAKYLLRQQLPSGAWGGDASTPPTIEETALACSALAVTHGIVLSEARCDEERACIRKAVERGCAWLIEETRNGTHFPPAPIGLYFARLWYHERLYPVVWTLEALTAARAAIERP
ncbi:MAG: hypothetical protein K1X78_08995 [Verrucomicrobiaceae bacterium]|nr:hypothetical protein [Verrucomicrobiaceae bacterium]